MKKTSVFLVLTASLLIPASSFATRVMTFKDHIAIQAHPDGKEAYVYWLKEKRSEFVMMVKADDDPGVATIKLDKNDVPQRIFIEIKRKDGKTEAGELPKSDPKNAELYRALEEHIAKFVKNNNVKQILKKYKK
jgi:hypothetical protein